MRVAGRDQQASALPVKPAVASRATRLMRAGAAAGVAAILFFCYWRQSQSVPLTSDGAGNALQAWDMLHGNLLLRHWWVSDVSFYTTELPQYMLIEALVGLGTQVVHVAAAMTYTLLVLLAALLAKGRAQGRPGLARALLAGGLMLAPAQCHRDPAGVARPHRNRGAPAGDLAADRWCWCWPGQGETGGSGGLPPRDSTRAGAGRSGVPVDDGG